MMILVGQKKHRPPTGKKLHCTVKYKICPVERWIVILGVVGSSPIGYPNKFPAFAGGIFHLFLLE